MRRNLCRKVHLHTESLECYSHKPNRLFSSLHSPPTPRTPSPPSALGLLVLFDALQMGSGASGFRILYAEGRGAFRWNRLAVLSPLCLKRHRAGSTIPNRLFRLICKNIYLLTFAARCTRPQSGVFSLSPPCLAVAVYSAG